MRSDPFTFTSDDGAELHVHRFLPDGAPRAVVHIAHGMSEHGARYARLAGALTAAGYAVYANDHRGHGRTARSDADLGFFASRGGWQRVVRDLELLVVDEREHHPGLPVALMGHSMGSFMVQTFLLEHAGLLDAAVLSASTGKPTLLAQAGRLVARLERLRLGERGKSALIQSLSFGAFNKQFAPTRTDFDWLSRDAAEVDAYIADPRCGFACTTSAWIDVLDGTAHAADPARQARIPHDLPVYIFAGARDPVSESGKGIERLVAEYRRAGLTRVHSHLYPEGRHETLNDLDREQVTADLLAWLDQAMPSPAR
jgi:alpha-beta hydrolase superfamily lysophospholipase